ncbi:uncharacterized protein PHALS_00367 [Plasmopara halstedii]|uniref:Uncharacterized protein n=1 Tax=Plasmopara halstedii TaxID=4781 RepID=A0A0P1A6N4_PLAHL|nr:uncharacterized protein PHALS_00367 [Plasmopara halstedii]CEG36046.1 hypothetical protein PHALS_00367 [Plasmopara halstedii]|eukprot:XP_024572415.1 hypothetical protein PHALS_00367 [Plasmopara halstedii]
MGDGATMASQLDNFSELVVAMEGVGDVTSLPSSHAMIVENSKEISLDEVEEKLLKEHEKIENAGKLEESAFKVRICGRGGRKNKQGGGGRQDQHILQDMRQGNLGQLLSARGFTGRCHGCTKIDHKKVDCPPSARSCKELFMADMDEISD